MRAGQNPRNNFALDASTPTIELDLLSGSEDWNLANLLIVDDDPAVQIATRLILERTGCLTAVRLEASDVSTGCR